MNQRTGTEVRAEFQLRTNAVELYIMERFSDRRVAVCVDRTMQTIEEGELWPDSAPLRLDARAASDLMDDLWRAGIRPTNFRDTPGETRAQAEHIRDLQALTHKLVDAVIGAQKP